MRQAMFRDGQPELPSGMFSNSPAPMQAGNFAQAPRQQQQYGGMDLQALLRAVQQLRQMQQPPAQKQQQPSIPRWLQMPGFNVPNPGANQPNTGMVSGAPAQQPSPALSMSTAPALTNNNTMVPGAQAQQPNIVGTAPKMAALAPAPTPVAAPTPDVGMVRRPTLGGAMRSMYQMEQ